MAWVSTETALEIELAEACHNLPSEPCLFSYKISSTNMETLRELRGMVVLPAEETMLTLAIQVTTRTTRHTWPTPLYTRYVL